MTLRRYIIWHFHNSAVLPHQGRDRTTRAILNGGCWWSGMYSGVELHPPLPNLPCSEGPSAGYWLPAKF